MDELFCVVHSVKANGAEKKSVHIRSQIQAYGRGVFLRTDAYTCTKTYTKKHKGHRTRRCSLVCRIQPAEAKKVNGGVEPHWTAHKPSL